MTNRNHKYLDKLNLNGYCPGFKLWEVRLPDDKEVYLMASDHESGLSTRIYFATEGAVQNIESAVLLGENPDRTTWDRAREKKEEARAQRK